MPTWSSRAPSGAATSLSSPATPVPRRPRDRDGHRPAAEGDNEHIAVHGGFISVQHDRVTILSDIAEVASQIDIERAKRAHEAAEAKVKGAEDIEHEAALRRAHARLAAAGALDATH